MTHNQLRAFRKHQLAEMAREKGIPDWNEMLKEELVAALADDERTEGVAGNVAAVPKQSPRRTPRQQAAARNISIEEEVETSKYRLGTPTRDLSEKAPRNLPNGYGKDRIVVMVRDPYWLHCYWELTRQAIQRAEAALTEEWHTSRPILRLVDVGKREVSNSSETIVRDIEIHGGSNNWYIDVADPPRSFRVDIGYLSRSGKFFVLAQSNIVTTPRAGISDVVDENWTDIDRMQAQRIFAMSSGYDLNTSSLELKQMFEERLRLQPSSPGMHSFGSGGFFGAADKKRKFFFQLDAELIVYGATEPDAQVTLLGEPIDLRPDGTFTKRFALPEARQILPAVANSADGIEERTIVLAVERNTRHLEPIQASVEA